MLVPLPKPPAVLRMEMHLCVLECFAWDVEQFDRVPSVAKKNVGCDRLQLRGGKEICSVVLPLSVLAKTFLMVMSS